jgi:hypothetical protein
MADNRSFKPVETGFEETWPNHSWAALVRLVFVGADWIQRCRAARSGGGLALSVANRENEVRG